MRPESLTTPFAKGVSSHEAALLDTDMAMLATPIMSMIGNLLYSWKIDVRGSRYIQPMGSVVVVVHPANNGMSLSNRIVLMIAASDR